MKQNLFKTWLMLCLFILLGGGNSVWAEKYTIDFNKGTTNGASGIGGALPSQISTMCQSGSDNASSITGTNCYYNAKGCGIRLAKNGGAGSLVVTLSDAIKAENVTQVIVYASATAEGNTLGVTPSGKVTTKTTFSDLKTYSTSSSASTNYELAAIDINGTLNTLTFEAVSKKYVHLHRIDIITGTSHELTGIEVNTPLTKSVYKVGDKFSTAGLTLTAHYDGADDKTITSGFTTSIANNATLSEAGDKTVTVTYGGKTCDVNISVFALTSLAITTEATKTKYKASEKFNKAGMAVEATWGSEDNPNKIVEDVTSSVTLNPTTTTALTSANDRIVVSYTHQGTTKTADQLIKVGDLNSISLITTGVKTSYLEKDESFDPANLVVTAHYTNDIDEEDVTSSATYNPTTSTKLTLADDKVTVSYTWNGVTKTADLPITVNAGPKYTVTFDGCNGTSSEPSATETEYHGGVTVPSATSTHNGWNFAGWAETKVTEATATAPTLYEAGSKYYPTQATTLYAVYTITEGGAVGTYKRAKSVSEVNAASTLVVVNGTNALNTSRTATTAPTEDANGVITPASTLILNWAGNSTDGYTLSNATNTLGASSLPGNSSSTNTSWTSSNNKWIVEQNTSGTDVFTMHVKGSNASLEYYSSNWKIYNIVGYLSNANVALKLYVPNSITAYTSVPAGAIIQPEVNFTTGEAHTIYLDANDKTYTDVATVTGVSKAISYESSKPAVATVDENGVVTALAIGTTTITAKVDAELGVSSAASDTYEITVKSASSIEGIKAITDAATVVDFTADLTDAVVTYVKGNHAYIQDACGAVYVSYSGHGLVAGKKINGAVSGKIKAANKIDQITSLTTSEATVTEDGVIPAAVVTTLANIAAAGAAYDGKLVTINDATVSNSMANTANSGASISDDETTSFNLYAPNKGVAVNSTEVGNFTGFISIYNGTSYRLNLYEQSQYVKTQSVAQDQEISFTTSTYTFDEDTEDITNFAGQAISGTVKGNVTYAKKEGDDIFTSIDAETGAVVLNGTCGTATIEATAAATDETVEGVTQPYNETKKTYTITVRPRYTVSFKNMDDTQAAEDIRQATFGASITLPAAENKDGYRFLGWTASKEATTADAGAAGATYTPTDITILYAVYAQLHTAKFMVNGKQLGETQNLIAGEPVVFPDTKPADKNGLTFFCWTNSEIDGVTDSQPTKVTEATMGSENLTFYAVFATEDTGSGPSGSITLSNKTISGLKTTQWAYDNTGKTLTEDDYTWTFDGTYHGSNLSYLQLGQKSGLIHTPTCPGNITSIVVNCKGATGRNLQVYSGDTKVGDATSTPTNDSDVTLTISGSYTQLNIANHDNNGGYSTSNNAININSVTVNYGTAPTYTNYCTTLPTLTVETENGVTTVTGTVTSDDVTSVKTSVSEGSSLDMTEATVSDDVLSSISTAVAGQNVLIYAPESSSSTAVNVVVDGKCANLVLTDKKAVNIPKEITATNITYERKTGTKVDVLEAGKYATVCLPYAFPIGDFMVMKFAGVKGGVVNFEYVTKTEPNVPYVIRPNKDEEASLSFNIVDGEVSVTTSPAAPVGEGLSVNDKDTDKMLAPRKAARNDATGFYGTYESLTLYGNYGYYGFASGVFKKANTDLGTFIRPFRAYLFIDSSNGARPASFSFSEGEATAINNVFNALDNNLPMYDLSGRRIQTPAKGQIVIVGGQKVMFK